MPVFQFTEGGIVQLNIPQGVGNAMGVQPGLCFLAGGTLGVAEKDQVVSLLFLYFNGESQNLQEEAGKKSAKSPLQNEESLL